MYSNRGIITKPHVNPSTGEIELQLIENESKQIYKNKISLQQIPSANYGVLINGYTEITEGLPASNQFKVDYTINQIWFNSSEEGKTVNVVRYYGEAFVGIDASMIWELNTDGDVVQTLQKIIDDWQLLSQEALDDFDDNSSNAIIEFNNNGNEAISTFNTNAENTIEEVNVIKEQYIEAMEANWVRAKPYTYTLTSDMSTIPLSVFGEIPYNPAFDSIQVIYQGAYLIEGKNYNLNSSQIGLLNSWVIPSGDSISILLLKGYKVDIPAPSTDGGLILNGTVGLLKLEEDIQNNINFVDTSKSKINNLPSDTNNSLNTINNNISTINSNIGDKSNLSTSDKTNLVNAINENTNTINSKTNILDNNLKMVTYLITDFPRISGETNDYNRFTRALSTMSNGDSLLLMNDQYDMGGNDFNITKRITIKSNAKPFYDITSSTGYGARLFNGGIIFKENGITIKKVGIICPDLDNGFDCSDGTYGNIVLEDCFSVARDHGYLFQSYKGDVKNISVVRCYSASSIHGFISKASNVNFIDCVAEGHTQYAFGNISDNMSVLATQMASNYDNTVQNCNAINCNYGFISYSRDKTNATSLSRVYNLKYISCSANNCTNPMKIGENSIPSGYVSIRAIDSVAINDFISYFSSGTYSIQLVNVANLALGKVLVSTPILYGDIASTGISINKEPIVIKRFADVATEISVNCIEATFYEIQARADDSNISTKNIRINKNSSYNANIKMFIRSNSGNPTFAGFVGDCINPTSLDKTLIFGTGRMLEWEYFDSIGKYLCVSIQDVKYT